MKEYKEIAPAMNVLEFRKLFISFELPKRARQLVSILLASGIACFGSSAVSAQSLSGFCLDTLEPGCMPRFIPFNGMSISFCEEGCELTNPVNVRGMDAVLYDLSCLADYDTPLDGDRILLLSQTSWDGQTSMSWIDARVTLQIVPCP